MTSKPDHAESRPVEQPPESPGGEQSRLSDGHLGRRRRAATARVLRDHIRPGSCVVEIGASDASFRRTFPEAQWLTVDKYGSPDLKCDVNGHDVTVPLPDRSVDVVICTEVLEHLSAGGGLVREMHRILRPDGVAVVSVPNIASLKCRLLLMAGIVPAMAASGDCGRTLGGSGILVDGHWEAAHVVDFTEKRLIGYLARGGLRVVDQIPVPVTVGETRTRPGFALPPLVPRRLCDFLLVVARPAAPSGV